MPTDNQNQPELETAQPPTNPVKISKSLILKKTSGRAKCGNSLKSPQNDRRNEKCNENAQSGVIWWIDIQPKYMYLYLIQPLDRLSPAHS